MCIQSFILIGCCVSELHGPLCPYHNVLPEAVYCYFTRTALFTKLFTCLYYQSLKLLSHHQVLLLYTLFYKNYIVYYNVYFCYCSVFTEMYVYTEFHLDWLLCE